MQDTVEWILPDLLDMFVSSDDAVVFEPTQAADAKGAEQATDAANYVFYKQNNGFLILYTAFKDALMVKNCATHWRKETIRFNEKIPVKGASPEMLALVMQPDDNLISAEEVPAPMMDPATGQPAIGPDGQPMMQTVINATLSRPSTRKVIKVEAFEPDNLLVHRNWTSPLLDECPYVARIMEVSLSDLKQMGFDDVTAQELAASAQPGVGESIEQRRGRRGLSSERDDFVGEVDSEDESLTIGYPTGDDRHHAQVTGCRKPCEEPRLSQHREVLRASMYVFHYHPQTGAYRGGERADFDQLEPGRVLVPYAATEKPVPKYDAETQWPFFVPARGEWEIRPLAAQATEEAA